MHSRSSETDAENELNKIFSQLAEKEGQGTVYSLTNNLKIFISVYFNPVKILMTVITTSDRNF